MKIKQLLFAMVLAVACGAYGQGTLTEYQFVGSFTSFSSGDPVSVTGLLWASPLLNNESPGSGSYIDFSGIGTFPLDTSAYTLTILPPGENNTPIVGGGSYTDGVNLFWHTGSAQYQGWAYFSQGNELGNGNGIWVPVAAPEPSSIGLLAVGAIALFIRRRKQC